MRHFLKPGLFILLILLSSCSSFEEHPNKANPYLYLSAEEKQEHVSDTNTQDDQDHVEINAQQQTDQDNLAHSQEVQPGQISTHEITTSKLPFQDFPVRWNAVTEEQMSNLYIQSLSNEGEYYSTPLTNNIELRVFVEEDHVRQLEIITNGQTKSTILSMLTGWNQIITILHPGIEMYEVDAIFNQLGVGPNANLTALNGSIFSYHGLKYEVLPIENGYVFKAWYGQ
jgi:hypothetical protein